MKQDESVKNEILGIRRAIKAGGFTVYRLAKVAGLSASTVHRIIDGETRNPSFRVLRRMTDAVSTLAGGAK